MFSLFGFVWDELDLFKATYMVSLSSYNKVVFSETDRGIFWSVIFCQFEIIQFH